MDLYVFGDLHSDYRELNTILKKTTPEDIIFQVGDFGYWRKEGGGYSFDSISNPNKTKIYFCSGNHEDFFELKYIVEENSWKHPIEIRKNLFFCPRGSSFKLPTSERVLFIGGALSTDKPRRVPFVSWFPEELITNQEITRIKKKTYDIVVSHTCPSIIKDYMLKKVKSDVSYDDPCCEKLQKIFEDFRPKKWFFGHWHTSQRIELQGCQFVCLNKTRKFGSFTKISLTT